MATINLDTTHDTICAISTPPGIGGIAVIRISGDKAIPIADSIFTSIHPGKTLQNQPANKALFGSIHDQDNIIDEVIAIPFRAPHSFTGEDTVEISCHGSLYIQQHIISQLIQQGCRMAEAGEFTRRAFASGRIDLSQAEAVADLIAANTAAAHRLAMNQMRGKFSQRLSMLRNDLLEFVSLIELELDFSEEDVEFADRTRLQNLADNIASELQHLADSFAIGNAIKNGIPTTIVGETNAGKSTLLNLLVHDEKALVSDIHGTTRDVIEDVIIIGGVQFRLIDTAGIRDTHDTIETMGIERTFDKLKQSNIVIWLIDSTDNPDKITDMAQRIIPLCADKHLIAVFNKADLLDTEQTERLTATYNTLPISAEAPLFISAKYNTGIDRLTQRLVAIARTSAGGGGDVIVTNIRHYEALKKALDAIRRVQQGLTTTLSADFIAQDIRECMHYLGEITGEITTNEILGSIFSRFCIGK